MNTPIVPQRRHIPKLPLRDTITLAYSSYVENFGDVLKISWLWLAVIVPLTFLGNWMEFSGIAGTPNQLGPGTHLASKSIGATALSLIVSLIFALAGFGIAVAWHRRLLLSETPAPSGSNVISNSLWHYVGVSFLIALIAVIPIAIAVGVVALFANIHSGTVLLIVLPYLLCIVMYAITLRLSLLLPARAVADLTLSFGQAWADTRGNTWRLFWGTAACAFLPLCAMPILLALVGFYNPNTFTAGSLAVINALSTLYSLLVLPIGIGFLSFAYRHFVGPASRSANA